MTSHPALEVQQNLTNDIKDIKQNTKNETEKKYIYNNNTKKVEKMENMKMMKQRNHNFDCNSTVRYYVSSSRLGLRL